MAGPPPGYQRPTERLGGSGRGPIAVAVTVAVFLFLVVLKPWESAGVVPVPTAGPQVQAEAHRTAAAGATAKRPTEPTRPPWPAVAAAIPSETIEAASGNRLDDLRQRAGSWGIWVAGVGPRILREEPWTRWIAVPPEPSPGEPSHVATWPDTDVCDRLPALPDRPSVVAVTTPAAIGGDPHVSGWWTNGAQVVSLSGSIGYLSTATPAQPGGSGAPLLVRVDGATWPAGRYELHVAAGASTTALTFCLEPIG